MIKKLDFKQTELAGLQTIEPQVLQDERGAFSRIFCQQEFSSYLGDSIKQINHSINKIAGTVRGLHYQLEPYAETKIIKCLKGSLIDIVVDIRKNSPTFLQYKEITLNAKKQNMIYIPKGFAHGFQTLEDNTELLYLHTSHYNAEYERALSIFDPKLGIKLPFPVTSISERDQQHSFIDDNFEGVNINAM